MGIDKLNIGIVGGGIGGVAAAVALHRVGIEATVYERAPELREVGAGMMLWPNATRVLRDVGLLEKVAALSGPARHFLVRGSTGAVLMDIALGRFDVPALCTRRADLLDALISALPAERIRLGRDFESFECRKHGVGVHFAGGISAEHDFLIGADGIRSRVRSQLLGLHEPIYRGYTVWRGLACLTGASSRPARTARRGGVGNASASSTRAAIDSHGTPPRTPGEITWIHPKAVDASFCASSRAGTSRSKV